MTYSILWQPALDRVLEMFAIESAIQLQHDNCIVKVPINEETAKTQVLQHLEWFIRSLKFETNENLEKLIKKALELQKEGMDEEEEKLLKHIQ